MKIRAAILAETMRQTGSQRTFAGNHRGHRRDKETPPELGLLPNSPSFVKNVCVNELCTVLHGDANQSNGRPGNMLKNMANGLSLLY